MRTFFFANLLFIFLFVQQTQAQTWAIDPAHSDVKFTVTHLVISEVEGEFTSYEGQITGNKSDQDFSGAKVSFSVDVNSVDTDIEKRDEHLRSAEFFDVANHPKMTFESTSFKKKGKGYELKGKLTMRGVTQDVSFDVKHGGTVKDPYGNTKAGFKATTTISRKSFGLTWSAMTEAGGAVVGDEVEITLNLQFAKK